MTTRQGTVSNQKVRLIALLTTVCLLLGIAPIVVLAQETEYHSQGDGLLVYMTSPSPSDIAYDPEQSTDEYYYNKIQTPFLAGSDVVFKIATGKAPGINNNQAILDNKVNVYATKDFTQTPVATFSDFTRTSIGNASFPDPSVDGSTRKGMTHTLTLADGKLPCGNTYYLVIDNLASSGGQGNADVGKKIVFEFSIAEKALNVLSVSLDVEELLFEGLGKTYALSAEVLPTTAVDKSVSYQSSDSNVVTVDADGVVIPVGVGTATVTVTTTDGGLTDSCDVEVKDSEVSRIFRDAMTFQTLANKSCEYRFVSPHVMRNVEDGRFLVVGNADNTEIPTFNIETTATGGIQYGSWTVNLYSDATLTTIVESPSLPSGTSFTYTPRSDLGGGTYYMVVESNSMPSSGVGQIGEKIIAEFTLAGEHQDPQPVPLTATKLTSSEGTSLIEKTETTLTAAATGGKAPYTYKFIVYNPQTNQWYKIRDFESSDSCTWYTGAAGTKTLYVDVKDSEGTVARKKLDVTVSADTTEPLTVTAFQSSKGTALTEKTETTLRATATGGKSPYTYKFIVYNTQTNQWFRIRDFESASTCTWYTGSAGTKVLYVDVKDSAGNVVRKELNVTVSENTSPLAASYFTSSKGSTLNSGDTTTLMAKATGGSGSGYRYKFIVYNPQTNQWYKIQDYSASSSASWYTGAAGAKTLYVDITDSAGNYVRTPLNVTVK